MIRFGLKILAVPLLIVFCVLSILAELMMKVYSLGMGIFINFVLICVVLAVVSQQWMNLGIFVGILAAIVVLTLLVGLVSATVEIWRDNLKASISADLQEGDELEIISSECKEGKMVAPKSFTEDTLLAAMEKAGADEIPDEAERKGLGTPATRAGVIEKLVRIGFLEGRGDKKTKYLVPTHKGEALITIVVLDV
jgi:DNA topoisomerase IA